MTRADVKNWILQIENHIEWMQTAFDRGDYTYIRQQMEEIARIIQCDAIPDIKQMEQQALPDESLRQRIQDAGLIIDKALKEHGQDYLANVLADVRNILDG